LLLERKKKRKRKSEKRFGEFDETLTFAPPYERAVKKEEKRRGDNEEITENLALRKKKVREKVKKIW
jgi:hypothetical protein